MFKMFIVIEINSYKRYFIYVIYDWQKKIVLNEAGYYSIIISHIISFIIPYH